MCFVWLDAFSYLWTELNLAFSFFSTSQPVLTLCEWAIIVCRGWTAYLSPEILMVYFTNSTCCQRNSCSGKFRCSFLCLSNWDSENHSDLSLSVWCVEVEDEGDIPKTLVKLRRMPSDAPRPASTPPVIAATAIQDEDDEEKIIAELEVRLIGWHAFVSYTDV